MFKPEKALQMGLVDELAKDKADAIERCKNYILTFDNIPGKIAVTFVSRDRSLVSLAVLIHTLHCR